MENIKERIKNDLSALGIKPGDVVLMHSSYKSLGKIEGGAEIFFEAFLELLGEEGTLVLPSLSYATVNCYNPGFNINETPSCVGYLSEFFRTSVPGVIRSMHATHSCCAKGKYAEELLTGHEADATPVGEHSPFTRLPLYNGKILMLGCGTRCNTMMHGVEEVAHTPYGVNWEKKITYVLSDGEKECPKESFRHDFDTAEGHIAQRYDRVIDLLLADEYKHGYVLEAECYIMDAKAAWEKGLEKMKQEPYFFVDMPK